MKEGLFFLSWTLSSCLSVIKHGCPIDNLAKPRTTISYSFITQTGLTLGSALASFQRLVTIDWQAITRHSAAVDDNALAQLFAGILGLAQAKAQRADW
ncbi:hypothetical protein BDW67DRAFT_153733 [Aspergillus spinulosporus]